MEAVVGDGDRRDAKRHADVDDHGILSVHVRPGNRAMLINISAGGALIETEQRLLPGASVDLLLERSKYRASVRGRVLRCSVIRVCAASMGYRGAVGFDRPLPWFEHERVSATHQVL